MKKYFNKAISVGLCLILGTAVLTGCEKSVTSSTEEPIVSSVVYDSDPKNMDPVLREKLRNDYLNFLNRQSEYYKLEDVRVIKYFGTYNGVDIVFMDAHQVYTQALRKVEVAGYKFVFGSSQLLYAHIGQDFIRFGEAYEQGHLTKEDIGEIKVRGRFPSE